MKRGFPAKPVPDMDGNLHPSPWAERVAKGYVAPRDRSPEEKMNPAPQIVSQKGEELSRLRATAQEYTTEALAMLNHIAHNGRNEAARVSACIALLDRGWGKPVIARDIKPQQSTKIKVVFGNDQSLSSINSIDATVIDADTDTDTDTEETDDDSA